MEFREIVDVQVNARTKTATVSVTRDLSEKKVTIVLKKKGYKVTAFQKVDGQVGG